MFLAPVKDTIAEKATEFVFNKFVELKSDKELKDKFKAASQKYFNEIFENCDLSNEFDFEAVEKYLLENMDKKIIAIFYEIENIGMHGRDSIREDILRVAVDCGNGNEEAIRKYCNAIIDFIGACLHDRISDSDKLLASEITSVTNEHYNHLSTEIENIGQSILNEIRYWGSFSEKIDTLGLPKAITINKFSYANPVIKFHGRNSEQKEIEKFMSDNRPLLFWSITGRGGVGKSKFALHICKKYELQNWKAVWLNKDKTEDINRVIRNNEYNKRLLFICDYASEYIETIKTMMLKLSQIACRKIRILLLERSGYSSTSNKDYFTNSDTWYSRLLLGHNSDEIKEIEYKTDSLNLDNYVLNNEDMFNILDDFSEKKLSLEDKTEIVDFVKNKLISVSDQNNNSHLGERCLFLLFTADACMNGNGYNSWDTEMLIKNYISRTKNSWLPYLKGDKKLSEYTAKILMLATVTGRFDINECSEDSIHSSYVKKLTDALGYDENIASTVELIKILNERDASGFYVEPMQPDLVGEFFFVNEFYNISPKHKQEWYKTFFSEKYTGYFCSFLRRCLDDWHSLENFKKIIKELFEFAVKNNYYNFIRECVNNSLFIGLSYYYELTEDDLLWLNNKLLINKNERLYIEYYGVLAIVSSRMSDANKISDIAKKIKDELLSGFNTDKISGIYAVILVTMSTKMSDAKDRLTIADRIKDEIFSKFNTPKIAEIYADALGYAAFLMSSVDEIQNIADRIKDEIFSKFSTPEIVEIYAKVLANATFKMSNVKEKLDVADRIKDEIFSRFNTPEIAEIYAMTLFHAVTPESDAKDVWTIIDRIKNEIFSKFNTLEIAEIYADALTNASAEMSDVNDILAIADRIKNEIFSKFNITEIAEHYAGILFNASAKMSDVNDRFTIADRIKDEIFSKFNTPEIAVIYAKALANMIFEMSNADEIRNIADKINDEIFSKVNTNEIAEIYAKVLVNAAFLMSNTDEIQGIADRIKNEIFSKVNTKEIAEHYAGILFNASAEMSDINDRLTIANRIKDEIFSKFNTPEIAVIYAKALANMIFKMSNADEMRTIAARINDEILIKFNTPEILEIYAKVLLYASFQTYDANEILTIADIIKDKIFSKVNTLEIAVIYIRVLNNATSLMSNADKIQGIANRINDEILSKFNTPEIISIYSLSLFRLIEVTTSAEKALETSKEIKEILTKYNTKGIAAIYIIALKYICKKYHEHENLLEEIEIVQREYDISLDSEW